MTGKKSKRFLFQGRAKKGKRNERFFINIINERLLSYVIINEGLSLIMRDFLLFKTRDFCSRRAKKGERNVWLFDGQ